MKLLSPPVIQTDNLRHRKHYRQLPDIYLSYRLQFCYLWM